MQDFSLRPDERLFLRIRIPVAGVTRFNAARGLRLAVTEKWRLLMETTKYKTALIVGAGEGFGGSLARLFTRGGIRVALAARQTDKLAALYKETGAKAYACDATDPNDVTRLFVAVERDCGPPDIVVYNAGARLPGALVDLIPVDVEKAIAVSAFGGF